ncbi:MAG: STAS domain-containing protein [Nitrospirae bacterium]|nr:STAS domain-containing protein [Nitrospirota bacterium]
MQVKTRRCEDKVVLSLSGRFDFTGHRDFRSGYEEVLKESGMQEIEVDLGGVDYMDSSALGMLLLLKEKAAMSNQKVILSNCKGTIRQILEVANFGKLFTIK